MLGRFILACYGIGWWIGRTIMSLLMGVLIVAFASLVAAYFTPSGGVLGYLFVLDNLQAFEQTLARLAQWAYPNGPNSIAAAAQPQWYIPVVVVVSLVIIGIITFVDVRIARRRAQVVVPPAAE